ncbi:MAG: DNA cytosine methyltransferase [Alphaproteobacteria bacterium]|nr:DNA cytosine methyltransferase [Alphaproteobacteria bacterium]
MTKVEKIMASANENEMNVQQAANGDVFVPAESQSDNSEAVANDNATTETDFVLPEVLQDKTLDEIFKNDYLSEDELASLVKKCANDNFVTLPTDPIANDADLTALLDQVSTAVKAKAVYLKAQPLSDEEYAKQLRKVQIEAAYQLLLEYMIGQDIKAIKGQKGLKKKSGARKTKKEVIRERYPRLGARQIRDFQKLELANIYAAVRYAIAIGEVPTRALALSADMTKKAQTDDGPKNESQMLKNWRATEDDFETVDKTLTLDQPIVATSLYANIGIGTCLVEKVTGIKIAVANEYDDWRAKAHSRLYPNCKTIIGSISDPKIFEEVKAESEKAGATFVFASPPCQDASPYNTADTKGTTERATLFVDTLKNIEAVGYKAGLIENVPQWLTSRPEKALEVLGDKTIGEYVVDELHRMKYKTRVGILSAADYGTAEDRKRCFILFWKEELGDWKFPKPFKFRPTVFETIGMLKTLEAGEVDPDNRWHYGLPLTEDEINFLRHTPTGMSAWMNSILYQPKNKDGSTSGGSFKQGYRRIDPAYPCPTITTGSGSVGDLSSVHYGRPLTEKGCFSDARVLSIHELLLLMGAPADFLDPLLAPKAFEGDFEGLQWENGMLISKDEHLVREALGEHVCPKMMLALLSTFPGDKIATEEKEADK